MTTFFSETLTSDALVRRLQVDLRDCLMCRFLVAYVSDSGIDTIGRQLLVDALSKSGSFGISSLSCSCGLEPLIGLQEAIGGTRAKLKYFMDPIVKGRGEPKLVLLHSKLVYLAIPSQEKSVVYIGSHNWTGPALSNDGSHNAEASLRIELPYQNEHPLGEGESIASQVNRHLLEASRLSACKAADEANRPTFQQWYDKGCKNNPTPKTDDTFIVLAVLKDAENATSEMFNELAEKGIYLRTDRSGKRMYLAEHRRLIVMLWHSADDLQEGKQPILIRCRRSSDVPDVSADVKSTNTSPSPIEGFGAAIFGQQSLTLWSGREVQAFEFEFQRGSTTSQGFDSLVGSPTPKYRFHLEVLNIVFPALSRDWMSPTLSAESEHVHEWLPDSFAVANKRKDFTFVGIDGYLVTPDEQESITTCFKDQFGVTESEATVWPTTECDQDTLGNFVCSHPLHETYLRSDKHELGSGKVQNFAKALIPKLPKEAGQDDADKRGLQAINRVEHGFVRQLDELFGQWMKGEP